MSSSRSLFLLFSLLSPRPKEDCWEIYLILPFLSFLSSPLFPLSSSKLARPGKKERERKRESQVEPSSSSSTKNAPSKKRYKKNQTLFLCCCCKFPHAIQEKRKQRKSFPAKKEVLALNGPLGTVHVQYMYLPGWIDRQIPPHPIPSPTPAPAPTRSQLLITCSTHQYQTSDIACSLAAPGFFFLGEVFFSSSFFVFFVINHKLFLPSSPLLSSLLSRRIWGWKCNVSLVCLFACSLLPALRRHGV